MDGKRYFKDVFRATILEGIEYNVAEIANDIAVIQTPSYFNSIISRALSFRIIILILTTSGIYKRLFI